MAVRNPFKGLKPFGPKDADALFGRDSDLTLMKDRIFRNKTTLFFAGSGVGKTSFFQAKLIPDIERRYRDQFKVLYHGVWAGKEPLEALKETLQLPASQSLQSFFDAAAVSDGSSPSSSSFILILDQFEELFQYQIYWPHFIAFRDELCSAINRSEASVRFIFSMREDFLGQLSVFDNRIPDLFANYYRLKNPDLTQAEQIIRRTAELSEATVDDGGIQDLIDDLSRIEGTSPRNRLRETFRRDYVFPPHLQLVCKRLWQIESARHSGRFSFLAGYKNLKRTKKTSPAQRLLKEICIERMNDLTPEQQDLAAKAFDYLVTTQGAKVAYELHSLARHMKEDRKQLAGTLERLGRDPRILRESTRQRERWFELYHDMYAPIMYEWKESFDDRRSKEREREQRGLIFDRKAIQEEARDNMDAALLFWLSALEIRVTDYRRRQVARIEKSTLALRKTFRHEGQITAMCFGTNGAEVVTASTVTLPVTSDDGLTENKEHTLLQVWNRDSGLSIGKPVEFLGKTTLVALHSDEGLVAAFGGNKLRIIDLKTRVVQPRRLPIDSGRETRGIQLNWYPNGKFLILELWQFSSWTWLSIPIKKSAKVKSARMYRRVVFDPTSRIAIAQKGRHIDVVDAATMNTFGPPVKTRGVASALAVSTNCKLFAAGFEDGKVSIWGTRSGKQASSTINTKGAIQKIVFRSPKELATVSVRKARGNPSLEVQRWNLPDGKQLGSPSVVSSRSAFLSRGATYAYVDRRFGPAAWRISTGKPIDARWIGRANASSIAWSDDDTYVLVNNRPNSVRLLSATDIPEVNPMFPSDTTAASSAILSLDGAHVACATAESVIVFGAKRRVTLKISSEVPVSHLAYGSDGRLLAILDTEGGIKVWDIQSGKRVASFAMHDDPPSSILVNPKGRSLAILGGKLRWWNFGESKTKILTKSENNYWNAQFSENGKILIVSNISSEQVEVWDTIRPNKIASIPNQDIFRDVVLSPDGKLVLTSTEGGEAIVWRTHGALLHKLNHQAPVDASAFSRSGRLAVTASQDNFIRLWDMGQGDEMGRFRVEGLIRDLRFTPDERGIIAASNWTVTCFDIDPSLVPTATRQLSGWWTGQLKFLRPDGRRLVALLRTGMGFYRTDIVNFDVIDAKPIDGSINDHLAMWQNRMGLLRDGEELIPASLVRASRSSAQPAKRNTGRIPASTV